MLDWNSSKQATEIKPNLNKMLDKQYYSANRCKITNLKQVETHVKFSVYTTNGFILFTPNLMKTHVSSLFDSLFSYNLLQNNVKTAELLCNMKLDICLTLILKRKKKHYKNNILANHEDEHLCNAKTKASVAHRHSFTR